MMALSLTGLYYFFPEYIRFLSLPANQNIIIVIILLITKNTFLPTILSKTTFKKAKYNPN